ncbi:MAG: bifunctional 2-C-methyl-D-erythritol 4-phosphate cytidylyltransferase/2-C-methyl-D-erythritol 2,4-cyclodiphosphate synthase [Rhodospirillales bacterium]
MMRVVAVIVAGGSGSRFGGGLPKQYRDLDGEPLIRRTLRAFATHPRVDAVLPVIRAEDGDLFRSACGDIVTLAPVAGGASRQASVRAGLEALASQTLASQTLASQTLAAQAFDAVLIHDAARPFVTAGVIDRVLDALADAPGALPALAVADTLKRADDAGHICDTVPRDGLWRAQTPQGFRFDVILAAHRDLAGSELTDDAALLEVLGLDCRIVAGDERNSKVTFPEDLAMAESAPAPAPVLTPRLGSGFDVHRFEPGAFVTLCGIRVPHDAGLAGHSDADVGLHALTDALFGAIGDGDIGSHFPPSDPQWKGAASDRFLAFAAERVRALGGVIANVDVTVICERPKVGPHREAMRTRVAEILDLDLGRVSVKATTTEGLGFTGRREGIAAQATALVMMPD